MSVSRYPVRLASIAVLTSTPPLKLDAHFRRQCVLMPLEMLLQLALFLHVDPIDQPVAD
jgi:hypothetical protein